jgi:pimeloyl-ACP methyl ester carboxylesterase
MASDVTELATHLGFESSRVAGEDWGAAVAYAVAAFYRSRVVQLVFQEMLLPGPVVPGDEVQLHSRRRAGGHENSGGRRQQVAGGQG